MTTQVTLGDISVDVVFKDIKNIHLCVYPPSGRVRISAPLRTSLDTVRLFAISKLAWIKHQQKKLYAQERETPREYLDRESHYVWGKRYLLNIMEEDAAPDLALRHSRMELRVRHGTNADGMKAIVAQWYRDQIKATLPELITRWEPILGVSVKRYFVQRMKTKWGGCNPLERTIRLNTELAKKPRECLEYVFFHELIHLLEPHHNDRFTALMDAHLPHWRDLRTLLNSAPLGHETWNY